MVMVLMDDGRWMMVMVMMVMKMVLPGETLSTTEQECEGWINGIKGRAG